MNPRDGVRDRFGVLAVEDVADGRPDSFDGNDTHDIVSWMIPQRGQRWTGLTEDMLEQLMGWTEMGHLAWVVFPINNV